jgi:two-component sensor histidine kinase
MSDGSSSDKRPAEEHQPVGTLADTCLANFGFVSDDERAALAKIRIRSRTLKAGEKLIDEQSTPDTLYLLKDGWAYRHITTRTGARQIPTLLIPGDICNLDNLLLERADFGVRALTKATVLALPREQALELTATYPGIGRAFTWLALAENAILSQWAVGLGRRPALERLAHLLCEISIRVSADKAGAPVFDLPLTQELIGDIIGITPIHVNRTLQQLRASNLVATRGRTVTIIDMAGLHRIANFDPTYLQQIAKSAETSGAPRPSGAVNPFDAAPRHGKRIQSVPTPDQQRAYTRDEDLLLSEINHRFSNDLQLIVSLLAMQSRRVASAEARQVLNDTMERVAILARARNALTGTRQSSLEAALEQVSEALYAQAEPRGIMIATQFNCETFPLSPTKVTTLALVVNELATNAIKHAFEKTDGGRIGITVELNNGRDLQVFVDDSGLPFSDVQPSDGSGFGTGLAKRLIGSIGGLFIAPVAGSKKFELRVPLESVNGRRQTTQ